MSIENLLKFYQDNESKCKLRMVKEYLLYDCPKVTQTSLSWLHTYHKTITKRDKCMEDFLQCFVWFVKQVFVFVGFAIFHKKGQLHKASKEFCFVDFFFVHCKKENCAKHEKCVGIILSSFRIRIILRKMSLKCPWNAISVWLALQSSDL